jgi:hypothetical protein
VTLHDLIRLAKDHGRAAGPGQWDAWLAGVSRFLREHRGAFAGDHNWSDGLMLLVYRHARIPTAQELAADMGTEWDDPVSTWEATCFLDALTASATWGGPPQLSEEDIQEAHERAVRAYSAREAGAEGELRGFHLAVTPGPTTQGLIDHLRDRFRTFEEGGDHAEAD